MNGVFPTKTKKKLTTSHETTLRIIFCRNLKTKQKISIYPIFLKKSTKTKNKLTHQKGKTRKEK